MNHNFHKFHKMSCDYQYTLDKSSRKFICPSCKKQRFVRYIDTNTGSYISDEYGRCDRESNCRYHLNPYHNGFTQGKRILLKCGKPQMKKIVFVPEKVLLNTLKRYDRNVFIQNLCNHIKYPFPASDIEKIISLYYLGTIPFTGAMTIPFIDIDGNIRAIQVKEFDGFNHTIKTTFLHSMIEQYCQRKWIPIPKWLESYKENILKVSCLFGEHLLNMYPYHKIILVEAPKTAIYGTLYWGFPEECNYLWLAVYNKSSFSFEKIKILEGREVTVFPDLSINGNTFIEWKDKAKRFEKSLFNTHFTVSNLLEQNASKKERKDGGDIADFLIEIDWRIFKNHREKSKKTLNQYHKKTETKKSYSYENREKCEHPTETYFLDDKMESTNTESNDNSRIEIKLFEV